MLQKGWNRFSGFFQKVWAQIKSLFGDTNAEEEIARINARSPSKINRFPIRKPNESAGLRTFIRTNTKRIEQDRQGAQQALGDMQAQEQSQLSSPTTSLQCSPHANDKARQEWQTALSQAPRNVQRYRLQRFGKLSDRDANTPGLDQLMAETQKKVDIVGTFNAATASGLGADSLSERTAKSN